MFYYVDRGKNLTAFARIGNDHCGAFLVACSTHKYSFFYSVREQIEREAERETEKEERERQKRSESWRVREEWLREKRKKNPNCRKQTDERGAE